MATHAANQDANHDARSAARLTAAVHLDPAFVAEGLAIKPAARTLLEAVIRMHTATSSPLEQDPPPHDPEDDACCHECPVCAIRRKARCAERLVAELDRELVLC